MESKDTVLLGKVTTYLMGMSNPAVSICMTNHTILPLIQLPDRFKVYTVSLQARETGLHAHELP